MWARGEVREDEVERMGEVRRRAEGREGGSLRGCQERSELLVDHGI